VLVCVLQFRCAAGPADEGIELRCQPQTVSVFQGEKIVFDFSAVNYMEQSIRPGNNFFISYHLYDEKGKSIAYDNRRYHLPRVLRRRKTTEFKLPVFFVHHESGAYNVEFDIVKEGKFWGSKKKWKTCKVKLNLKPLVSPEFKEKYLDTLHPTGNPRLDREQYLLRVTYKNCELHTPEGKLFGFVAGSTYPQVWIRDTATFIRYARLFYPLESLADSVELFMKNQSEDGEVADRVELSGQTGKNTVETDQESSLVLAAAVIAGENPQWLKKPVKGKTVLQRLEAALEWVWEKKRSKEHQLVYSAFTADWGDTDNSYPDQRATRLNDRSTLVFGIYTQAKYIQAIDALVRMFKQAGDSRFNENIRRWEQRMQTLKQQTVELLYLKDKGYFISHLVPGKDQEKYFAMEKEMLAVGGNAEAMIAGLMDREQIKRFLGVLEQRRKEYKLRTVSFTLLPPYPGGFFSHPLLKHPWSYQNGGEWDWIGARVVKGLFMYGFREEAETYLMEIVDKNLANYCIYEWEDRGGTGRGALFYVGAAGVIGDAIMTGYSRR
jgi:hypothetical protein